MESPLVLQLLGFLPSCISVGGIFVGALLAAIAMRRNVLAGLLGAGGLFLVLAVTVLDIAFWMAVSRIIMDPTLYQVVGILDSVLSAVGLMMALAGACVGLVRPGEAS